MSFVTVGKKSRLDHMVDFIRVRVQDSLGNQEPFARAVMALALCLSSKDEQLVLDVGKEAARVMYGEK